MDIIDSAVSYAIVDHIIQHVVKMALGGALVGWATLQVVPFLA